MDLRDNMRLKALEDFCVSQAELNNRLNFAMEAYSKILYENDLHEDHCPRWTEPERVELFRGGAVSVRPIVGELIKCTCVMAPIEDFVEARKEVWDV